MSAGVAGARDVNLAGAALIGGGWACGFRVRVPLQQCAQLVRVALARRTGLATGILQEQARHDQTGNGPAQLPHARSA